MSKPKKCTKEFSDGYDAGYEEAVHHLDSHAYSVYRETIPIYVSENWYADRIDRANLQGDYELAGFLEHSRDFTGRE